MVSTTLENKAVGDIVKIKVGNTLREFIIVHQGKPYDLYDSSCNGTWLLMKEQYEKRIWHTDNENDYANSNINSFLKSTILPLFDTSIQSQIKQIKIPYRPGIGTSKVVSSGENGLSVKIILLSCYEVGYDKNDSGFIVEDGAKLDYFKDKNGSSEKIGYFNGDAMAWWLRSPHSRHEFDAYYVNDHGYFVNENCRFGVYGVRPAIVLPPNTLISDDNIVNANTAPLIPASITIPQDILSGQNIVISWVPSTDAENNLEGYSITT